MAEQPAHLDSTGRDPLVFYLFDVDGTLTEVRKVMVLINHSHILMIEIFVLNFAFNNSLRLEQGCVATQRGIGLCAHE